MTLKCPPTDNVLNACLIAPCDILQDVEASGGWGLPDRSRPSGEDFKVSRLPLTLGCIFSFVCPGSSCHYICPLSLLLPCHLRQHGLGPLKTETRITHSSPTVYRNEKRSSIGPELFFSFSTWSSVCFSSSLLCSVFHMMVFLKL